MTRIGLVVMKREGEQLPANRRWHQPNGAYRLAHDLGAVTTAYGPMIAMHPWLPRVVADGSFLAFVMSFVTLSTLITAPECCVPSLGGPKLGFPRFSGAGRLAVKDAILTGMVLRDVDVANAILHAVSQPAHVNVSEIVIRPTIQAF